MVMTDCMVDIETTGLSPDDTAIIQIGAIKFNYDTEEIGEPFSRCLSIQVGRYWDEDTRGFWMGKNRSVFDTIVARMESPELVMRDFYQYAIRDGSLRFWAKPTSFDFPFLQSYFRSYSLPMPFHYRTARDLGTYIAARAGGVEHVDMNHVESGGDLHDALADAVFQLRVLFEAKHGHFGAIDTPFTEIPS